MTRFIDPSHLEGTATPIHGDTACYIGSQLRVFDKYDSATNQRYWTYEPISSTKDEFVLSGESHMWNTQRPCEGYAVYDVSHLPTTVENSAEIVSAAFLVTAIIGIFVWGVVRPLFPRRIFTGVRV